MAMAHYLGNSPTKTRRQTVARIFRDIEKALPCAVCREQWTYSIKSFKSRHRLSQYTENTHTWFTFVFDFKVAWNLCTSSSAPECRWQSEIDRFAVTARRPNANKLVRLFPRLYDIAPDGRGTATVQKKAAAAAAEGCDGEVCPVPTCAASEHIISGNIRCDICNSINWGPYYWRYLHRLAQSDHLFGTAKQRRWLWDHMQRVASAVPCTECYAHWQNAMAQVKRKKRTVMASPISLFTFVHTIHNVWNVKLNKEIGDYPWDSALQDVGWPEPHPPHNPDIWR